MKQKSNRHIYFKKKVIGRLAHLKNAEKSPENAPFNGSLKKILWEAPRTPPPFYKGPGKEIYVEERGWVGGKEFKLVGTLNSPANTWKWLMQPPVQLELGWIRRRLDAAQMVLTCPHPLIPNCL